MVRFEVLVILRLCELKFLGLEQSGQLDSNATLQVFLRLLRHASDQIGTVRSVVEQLWRALDHESAR